MYRYLCVALVSIVLGLFGGIKAFAGEPHKPTHPTHPHASPAAPSMTASPSAAASPTQSQDATAVAGAGAQAIGGGSNSSITSSVRAYSLGTSAAVSPASCDSAILSGMWTKESWICSLLKRMEVAEALGQRAVALQLGCTDEIMRGAIEAIHGQRACRVAVHPASRYAIQPDPSFTDPGAL